MNAAPQGRPARAFAWVLLFLLPLAWTPLTADLRPQKSLAFALALPLAAVAKPSRFALASLVVGFAWLLVFPDAPWPILVVFASPSAHGALSALVVADRAFVLSLARRALLAVSIVALAAAAGILPITIERSAFRLPYPVLVGTLGNPNYLAAFVLLAMPLAAAALPSPDKRVRLEAIFALASGALVALLSRSHLAALVLAGEALVFAPRLALGAPLAALALAPIALSSAGFVRALQGRMYLLTVHLRGFSFRTLFTGVGPSEVGPRFLDWQAEHLAAHPEETRFWTFPEHPHDDLVALPLAFGLVATIAGFVLLRRRLVLAPSLDARPLRAAWLALSLLSLGAGLAPSPVSWAYALLLAACTFRPRDEAPAPPWVKPAQVLAASVWFVVTLAEVHVAHVMREAEKLAAVEHDPLAALRRIEGMKNFPFDRGRLLHLEGRILLEAGKPHEAALVLREATLRLPHPIVWKALCVAERTSGRPAEALAAARAWLRVRPGDPDALAELYARDKR